ncbi:MAG: DUF5004 domain-containing protein [Dysgonamonadaceae bacterium]|jgi:hypothetical protein|nr:DUF5004 domain-containing protein [Dysgonamonadaceae bacterium]
MEKHINRKLLFLSLILALSINSCNTFDDNAPSGYTESAKNIDGTWKIIKVTRNSTDITALMDFSRFHISFHEEDNTYTIDNYLPFLVKSNGTWSLDDPQYPFNLVFEETSGERFVSGFNYPVVNGKRQISLSFSPGCKNNIYTYVFEKEN